MDDISLKNLRARADAKLRFAMINLVELRSLESYGTDFDRVHQESFIYQLLGAKDAFLGELNIYYEVGLADDNISLGKLRKSLEEQGKICSERDELYNLETLENSWLFDAKSIRDYSTHVSNVPRQLYLGGEFDHQVHLRNPISNHLIEDHFVIVFEKWHTQMVELLERLRASAIETNRVRLLN